MRGCLSDMINEATRGVAVGAGSDCPIDLTLSTEVIQRNSSFHLQFFLCFSAGESTERGL